MIPLDKIDRIFAYVLASAKRARQLQGGARPLVQTSAHKFTRTAMQEVIAGQVPFDLPLPGEGEAEDGKARKGKGKRAS
ncbi:MAG: DNA-directed RNA polymerase subunit omega [Terriglobia bacterium]